MARKVLKDKIEILIDREGNSSIEMPFDVFRDIGDESTRWREHKEQQRERGRARARERSQANAAREVALKVFVDDQRKRDPQISRAEIARRLVRLRRKPLTAKNVKNCAAEILRLDERTGRKPRPQKASTR